MKENQLYPTNLKVKQENINKFLDLIKDQIEYGGKKYAHSEEKEATDLIVEVYGIKWLLGTIFKYLLRFGNQGREKDLLKTAAYCYILWLKYGFHLKETHDTDTSVKS